LARGGRKTFFCFSSSNKNSSRFCTKNTQTIQKIQKK
jgi:hypothetical protein